MELEPLPDFDWGLKTEADLEIWAAALDAACKRSYQETIARTPLEGYSSWEEYYKKSEESLRLWEQNARAVEKQLEEKARATGRTIREVVKEHYGDQLEPSRPSSPGIQCECQEHLNPFFCPQALVDYRSQDLREAFKDMQDQHRISADQIRIKADDVSRRLDQDLLEYAWTLDSPESTQLPFWAQENQLLQNQTFISRNDSADMDAVVLYDCNEQQQIPSQPPYSEVQLAHHNQSLSSLEAQPTHHNQSLAKRLEDKAEQTKIQPKQTKRGRKRKPVPTVTTRPSGVTKVLHNNSPPATRTRSRKVARFFELGHDSHARPLQKP